LFYYYIIDENEKNNEDNFKNKSKKIVKSISQKNWLTYIKTLHNYLLDFESNNESHPLDNKENHTSKNNKNIKIINNYLYFDYLFIYNK